MALAGLQRQAQQGADNPLAYLWKFRFEDGLVLAHPDFPVLAALNGTASIVYPFFGLEDGKVQAVKFLCDSFSVSFARSKRDVNELFKVWSQMFFPGPFEEVPTINVVPPKNFLFSATYCINDFCFRLGLTSTNLIEEFEPRLGSIRIADVECLSTFTLSEQEDGVFIFNGPTLVSKEPFLGAARVAFLQEVVRMALPNRKVAATLHAGAVALGTNGIILSGPSFAGKSTLCLALLRRGFQCYSDDLVVLDNNFNIIGMPFALSIREGSRSLFPELGSSRFVPSNLGRLSPSAASKAFVVVNYQAASQTSLETLPSFEAFTELQKAGFSVEHTEVGISRFLGWLVDIPRFKLTYSVLEDAVEKVSCLLD